MVTIIFGYGTLIPMSYQKFPIVAEVNGYKRVYHDSELFGFPFPFAIKKENASMRGILMLETKEGLSYWDTYEGYPSFYDRKLVPVEVISDKQGLLPSIPPEGLHAWLYVPSHSTESLRLDSIFKMMKRQDRESYDEMMEKDTWVEKMARDNPELVEALPELFVDS